ncbi:hypothetical protein BU24DRAFT_428480 [Aaosphaeria arxii CBS 175.79]|uniref:Uncharacterized protein n=1 Tax=Aaosphaeria arxii CBS 175.79 TaxID=1450172 RepID=A0A6A5X9Z3_9PLEO|nr:uncharacterized protein BU24DRAFT_428480 [Aaosphaeria arxii CBS 175.79]KAF2009587.1 hypothetical protein BU24DRAFT_428480 [Aaosphaeria arxii CBS 175.79]
MHFGTHLLGGTATALSRAARRSSESTRDYDYCECGAEDWDFFFLGSEGREANGRRKKNNSKERNVGLHTLPDWSLAET